jgi:hypothetical protein
MMNIERGEKKVSKVSATFYGQLEVEEQQQSLGVSHVKTS